jgi:SNF family Na+-dependent transporter
MEAETFLYLNGIGWAAISSIATLLAVIVALFLPLLQDNKKKRNLLKLFLIDILRNYDLLVKANSCKDTNINGALISRVSMMCAVLQNIDNSFWTENKQTIAEISSKKYSDYNTIQKIFLSIKKHIDEIMISQGKSPFVGIIEDEVQKGIQDIESWIKPR